MGWLRALALGLILAAGLVAVDGVAASSTAPRPDPPPVKKTPPPPPRPVYRPPPPPVYQPPPPVYQAPPPPPVASRPPASSGPTAAQIRAAQRAAARVKAARRAARLKKQRREDRQKSAAARLAAAGGAQKSPLARRDASTRVPLDADGDRAALPFVVAATVAALIIFGIGLVPARAVPSYRMSVALETHRGHVALAACITLLVAAISFTLTAMSD